MSHKEYCSKHNSYNQSCKDCQEVYRLYHREWEREKAKDPIWRKQRNQRSQKHREKYSDEIKKKKRDYYAKNRLKIRKQQICQKRGITTDEYDRILLKQDNKCAICGSSFFRSREPCLDHDHKTGQVRAMLCMVCNTGVGYVEIPNFVVKATEYLNRVEEKNL